MQMISLCIYKTILENIPVYMNSALKNRKKTKAATNTFILLIFLVCNFKQTKVLQHFYPE